MTAKIRDNPIAAYANAILIPTSNPCCLLLNLVLPPDKIQGRRYGRCAIQAIDLGYALS